MGVPTPRLKLKRGAPNGKKKLTASVLKQIATIAKHFGSKDCVKKKPKKGGKAKARQGGTAKGAAKAKPYGTVNGSAGTRGRGTKDLTAKIGKSGVPLLTKLARKDAVESAAHEPRPRCGAEFLPSIVEIMLRRIDESDLSGLADYMERVGGIKLGTPCGTCDHCLSTRLRAFGEHRGRLRGR